MWVCSVENGSPFDLQRNSYWKRNFPCSGTITTNYTSTCPQKQPIKTEDSRPRLCTIFFYNISGRDGTGRGGGNVVFTRFRTNQLDYRLSYMYTSACTRTRTALLFAFIFRNRERRRRGAVEESVSVSRIDVIFRYRERGPKASDII